MDTQELYTKQTGNAAEDDYLAYLEWLNKSFIPETFKIHNDIVSALKEQNTKLVEYVKGRKIEFQEAIEDFKEFEGVRFEDTIKELEVSILEIDELLKDQSKGGG